MIQRCCTIRASQIPRCPVGEKDRQCRPELELRTAPSRCWPWPVGPVPIITSWKESHGLQGGSLAVASGEFCDCIRRPCSSSWEAGGCSLHYLFFLFINYNSADLCRRRTYRKRSISHLITVPDFAAAFTHLSKLLPLTSAELKKSPCFIKWHQIKLVGFCSRPSDMLPKSSPDAAQAVGNLILLVLMKALSSSSRDCTLRSAYADGSSYFFACPADLFSYVMIRKASQHSQTSLAYGKY